MQGRGQVELHPVQNQLLSAASSLCTLCWEGRGSQQPAGGRHSAITPDSSRVIITIIIIMQRHTFSSKLHLRKHQIFEQKFLSSDVGSR